MWLSSARRAWSKARSFNPRGTPAFMGACAAGIATAAGASAAEHCHPQNYPWVWQGKFKAHDKASVRRGFQVYREVCSACHSLNQMAFRNLVGVTHTETQMKEVAKTFETEDGPNFQGEMYTRPCALPDRFPDPYKNPEAAAAANNGAAPPDMSWIIKARENGPNYVFNLLTGYREKPAGLIVAAGAHFNPYMEGGIIAMGEPLVGTGQIDYEDGTESTVPQMAKDVVEFLSFCSYTHEETRKQTLSMGLTLLVLLMIGTGFAKRRIWNVHKTRRVEWTKPRSNPGR